MRQKTYRLSLTLIAPVLFLWACSAAQTEAPPEATVIPTPVANQVASPGAPVTEPSANEPEAAPTNTLAVQEVGIRYVLVPERSAARYLVTEQLVNVALPNDAIGTTQDISGSLVLNPDGTILSSESEFIVDLRTLRSDQSRRDNFLRSNVLGTGEYPYAIFVPTQITGLPETLPSSGEVAFTLIGDLTIREVTRQVEWDVTGSLQADELVGQARTSFTFADFNLVQPRVSIVLSIEDEIRLEVDLALQRVGS